MNEHDVSLTNTGDVLTGKGKSSVLDGSRGQLVVTVEVRDSRTNRTFSVSVESGRCREARTVVTEDSRGGSRQGVTSLYVEVLSHVATEETRSRSHDVVERSVQKQFRNCNCVAVLSNGDGNLLSRQCVRGHTNTFGEGGRVNREVLVTQEVDAETRSNAKFRLLYSKLLEAEDGHGLEQDFLRPDGLNSLRELAVGARVSGRCGSKLPRPGNGRSHSFLLKRLEVVD